MVSGRCIQTLRMIPSLRSYTSAHRFSRRSSGSPRARLRVTQSASNAAYTIVVKALENLPRSLFALTPLRVAPATLVGISERARSKNSSQQLARPKTVLEFARTKATMNTKCRGVLLSVEAPVESVASLASLPVRPYPSLSLLFLHFPSRCR